MNLIGLSLKEYEDDNDKWLMVILLMKRAKNWHNNLFPGSNKILSSSKKSCFIINFTSKLSELKMMYCACATFNLCWIFPFIANIEKNSLKLKSVANNWFEQCFLWTAFVLSTSIHVWMSTFIQLNEKAKSWSSDVLL